MVDCIVRRGECRSFKELEQHILRSGNITEERMKLKDK